MNLSCICQECRGHTTLWGEIDDSVTYLAVIHMGIICYGEKQLNLSRISEEYTRHSKLWGETDESVM
jgi:hypothetical protein